MAKQSVTTRETRGASIYYVARQLGEPLPLRIDDVNCVLFDSKQEEGQVKEIYIQHFYKSRLLLYRYADDNYLDRAKMLWDKEALDRIHPTASVIVSDDTIISEAGNGKFYETADQCERKKLNVLSGTRYDLCNGNHDYPNHSERKASEKIIEAMLNKDHSPLSLYLYGHWWCCEPCCEAMIKAGVREVIISKEWTKQFLGIEEA